MKMKMLPLDDGYRVVNPDMVILARESRGLTQATLSQALGITQGRLSKIETGLLPVPDDLLHAMSAALQYPPEFFSQGGALYGVGIAEVFHRKRADTPKKLLTKIYAQIEVRIRQVAAMLRAVDVPVSLRRLDIDEFGGKAQDVARLTRATWGIPRGPIHDLTKTAEDAGIVIIPMDFETAHIDAISRWIPGMPPMVFANERSPRDRYRFSLAHEIGHLLMHQYPGPEMERQADAFAAELLCPEQDIRADLVDLKLDRLPQLKRYWKVSMRALIHRAQDIGAISANRARYLWTKMAEAGYTKREPIELDIVGEEPSLIFEMVEVHRETFNFSIEDLRRLLLLEEHEMRIAYLPKPAEPRLRLVVSS